MEFYSLVPFHQLRPSLEPGRVGSSIVGFGACSAFTHVTACTLAQAPSDSLYQRLQQFRCLHCCSDCYRVERTSSRAGLSPAVDHHLSRRTRIADNKTVSFAARFLRVISSTPPSRFPALRRDAGPRRLRGCFALAKFCI